MRQTFCSGFLQQQLSASGWVARFLTGTLKQQWQKHIWFWWNWNILPDSWPGWGTRQNVKKLSTGSCSFQASKPHHLTPKRRFVFKLFKVLRSANSSASKYCLNHNVLIGFMWRHSAYRDRWQTTCRQGTATLQSTSFQLNFKIKLLWVYCVGLRKEQQQMATSERQNAAMMPSAMTEKTRVDSRLTCTQLRFPSHL